LILLWTWSHEPDAKHFDEEAFAPSTVPPGFCGALVGPIAIFIAGTAICGCPTDLSLATAKPESAIAATAAKIKYFI